MDKALDGLILKIEYIQASADKHRKDRQKKNTAVKKSYVKDGHEGTRHNTHLRVLGDLRLGEERHREVAALLLLEEELGLRPVLPGVRDARRAQDASFRENPLFFFHIR